MKFEEAKKYKWFFTKSGKLVVGGKSAIQNDELLKKILKNNAERYVMHTSHPGSPFCIILSEIDEVSQADLEECAIFCGSFSRAWKEGKKKTEVHIFTTKQLSKNTKMKTGTWSVNGKIKNKIIELSLVLVKQKEILRAVPEKSVNNKEILLKIIPGKIDKSLLLAKFAVELEGCDKNEILSALPAGGIKVQK